ncbi:shieldin complex subunit 1 isoform X1 [Varanus komodoensis]|uniref:shieldin complex subunit 1 isoform X1 n=1 Tax=Varanus komodoensis TaxID=61221 RepID=UPI001CF7B633|nr:shieldin complex subunit 1 isoform X1 [Varanus komodoensis]
MPFDISWYLCIPAGMGSSVLRPADSGCMELTRIQESYQFPRTSGHIQDSTLVRGHSSGPNSSDNLRQHCNSLLSEQTRRDEVTDIGQTIDANLGMVHPERRYSGGSTSCRYGQCGSRSSEQTHVRISQMGTRPPDTRPPFPLLGFPRNRLICHPTEQGMRDFLLESGNRTRIIRGCLYDPLEQSEHLRFPSDPPHESDIEDNSRRGHRTADHPLAATPSMVFYTSSHLSRRIPSSSTHSISHYPARRHDLPPRFSVIEIDSLANPITVDTDSVPTASTRDSDPVPGSDTSLHTLNSVVFPKSSDPTNVQSAPTNFHPDIQHILDSALKPSTRKSYAAKWRRFSTFAESHSFLPLSASTHQILQFLLELHHSGLKLSSIKVYMAAISYYHGTVGGPSIFSQPFIKRFLKGLYNLNPTVRPVMPTWSLSVVLQELTRAPFEPLVTIDLRLVSWKKAFLVAVTSARRASELCVVRLDPPYLNFHREKVVLRMDPSFLPKVTTSFHMGQDIVLPAFFLSPTNPLERSLHTLDIRRCLAFYRSRTESIRRSNKLFVKYSEPNQGLPVTPQRLSKWIVHTITLSYQLFRIDLPTIPSR